LRALRDEFDALLMRLKTCNERIIGVLVTLATNVLGRRKYAIKSIGCFVWEKLMRLDALL
jgi:hypothetical protein